jgi:hypothetical protein
MGMGRGLLLEWISISDEMFDALIYSSTYSSMLC